MAKKENIISVSINSGTSSNFGFATLDAGNVIGVVAYSSNPTQNHNNTGMVRAEILKNESAVADLQPIDNFRSRNVPYNLDGKPLEDVGGYKVTVKVSATEQFSSDTVFDFVFIYEN